MKHKIEQSPIISFYQLAEQVMSGYVFAVDKRHNKVV